MKQILSLSFILSLATCQQTIILGSNGEVSSAVIRKMATIFHHGLTYDFENASPFDYGSASGVVPEQGHSGSYTYKLFNWMGAGFSTMLIDNVVLNDITGGDSISPPITKPKNETLYGVNLAGAEFGGVGLNYGSDYIYPSASDLDYFKSKGLMLIRMPFLWERVQRSLYAPLDTTELSRIRSVTAAASSRGMKIVLDAHNYARYNGNVIGTAAVPYAAFRDFWKKMAIAFASDPGVYAYDTMNEPHDLGSSSWQTAAQEAVSGIREADMRKLIYTEGDCWSGAHSWRNCNESLRITDPANNHAFQAHQYFDKDSSGRYAKNYDGESAYPNVGVDRLKPFADWLKANNVRGMIGEYGVPGNDPRWNTVLDNFMKALSANCISGTYWAAGIWWGDYILSVQPNNGVDRNQMLVLKKYKSNPACQ